MDRDDSKQWQSLEERAGEPQTVALTQREFREELPVREAPERAPEVLVQLRKKEGVTRRGFFELMGLSAAAAGMAACQRAPVAKVLPYQSEPDGVIPGSALWYASACGGCDAQCGVLYKTRDGRPIKVEGNPKHPVSQGGVCAVGQASILSLYDASRARGPLDRGAASSWTALDQGVRDGLQAARKDGKAIRVIAPARSGPTFEAALAGFVSAWDAKVVRFEATGEQTALAQAHEAAFGVRALPAIHLDRARVIASFACDFLGTYVAPVAFARDWSKGRALPEVPRAEGEEAHPSPPLLDLARRHWQLEPALSLTGANADRREAVSPSELAPALTGLVRRLAARSQHPAKADLVAALPKLTEPARLTSVLDTLAAELVSAGERALVLSGATDPLVQGLAIAANQLLGAYGHTINLRAGVPLPAPDLELPRLLSELRDGQVGALLVLASNPVHAHPEGAALSDLLRRAPLTVSTNDRADETAQSCRFLAPDHAPAESWGDAEPRRGVLTLRQPALQPLFDTRSATESLLAWSGHPAEHHALVRSRVDALASRALRPEPTSAALWTRVQHEGHLEFHDEPLADTLSLSGLAHLLAAPSIARADTELWLHPSVSLRDGRHANNAWLHEVPDPLTKLVWDNAACMAPSRGDALGLRDGDLLRISAAGRSVELPVVLQPGTHPDVIAVSLGYGRTAAGTVGNGIGVNVAPLASTTPAGVRLFGPATFTPAGRARDLSRSQTHASLEGRPHIHTATLAEFAREATAGNPAEETLPSIWPEHEYPGHRWGMAIDLSSCTGCSACVVSCQAENNVPAVGKLEVSRGREMHWLRIDRYFAGEPSAPEVLHQPVMCQHCTNAPCETVCPVLATVHSSEGLNQQVYNRCVGTRYCANNCPPKVRRFNWFEYTHDDPIERLALNPDVVVRGRGVMEKCSLCVQRIQEGKASAKRDGRALLDGEVQTACQQSCPTQAIVFGDLNDPTSRLSRLAHDARAYRLLHELNIGPAISYLTRVKNPGARG